ncbi:polysaccharide biosynthesis/export family protein [Silvibacterium sp.]|uniref:polysaccharide biosynthesis/export family protein n=1 Tax=Silvibacterium sp. TaxID=1964179 RepID=UPI0039E68D0B
MKSLKNFVWLMVVLAGGALSLHAQVAQQPQDSLLIAPGDLVHISILDAPELEQHARVTDNGNLPLMVGGNVKVAGMTPLQASEAIGAALVAQHYLVNPRVAVTVAQYAEQNISVLGEVRLPGAYPVTSPKSVAEVLALAGGLQQDADRNVVIQRHGTGEMVTYYSSNQPTLVPDSAAPGLKPAAAEALRVRDTMVYPGDVVRVARAELVYAIGDFNKPGGFPIVNNDSKLTVLQLVAFAGGADKSASVGKARLVRKDPEGRPYLIKLNLGDMEKGKKPDMTLQANDIIYLPFSFAKNSLLGISSVETAAATASVYAF